MASYGLVLPEVFPKGTGIVDIKQITTSTDDNGENVIQAELFNGKKVEFKIRNGSKGNTGAAAGFTTPTAEIDDNTGKPSVEVTASGKDTAKKFHFSFKNLKGNKGDTGAAAGFTTPTAEIDNNTGVPNVAVTATGDDTKKKFHFTFKNLKGDKGDTGDAAGFDVPTAEVDNAVGTPSVTVTATGDDTKKKFHFTFKNLKGDKGDRGDLTDSVLAVIQNATHDLQQAFKRELYEETKARISSDNAEELARTQAINQEVEARTNAIDAEAKARIEGDKSIADYGDPSGNRKIQVGYAGPALQAGQVAHLAGYTHDGAKLKDVTEEAVRKLLKLDSVDNTSDSQKSVKYAVTAGSAKADGGNADTVGGYKAGNGAGMLVPVVAFNVGENAGYIKLGNGLIVQWGYSGENVPEAIFPIRFSNANYKIIVRVIWRSNYSAAEGHSFVDKLPDRIIRNGRAGFPIEYIAIGI